MKIYTHPLMTAPLDITGQKFGKLVAIRRVENHNGQAFWLFQCDCGLLTEKRAANVVRGITTKCGGPKRAMLKRTIPRHGMHHTSLHYRWAAMLARCSNPKDPGYKNYGARGIRVCDAWADFTSFASWAAESGYREDLELDRRNNDGPYAPHNCRWVTRSVNSSNRRNARMVTAFGETLNLSEAARKYGLNRCTLENRLTRSRMAPEKALTEPVGEARQRG